MPGAVDRVGGWKQVWLINAVPAYQTTCLSIHVCVCCLFHPVLVTPQDGPSSTPLPCSSPSPVPPQNAPRLLRPLKMEGNYGSWGNYIDPEIAQAMFPRRSECQGRKHCWWHKQPMSPMLAMCYLPMCPCASVAVPVARCGRFHSLPQVVRGRWHLCCAWSCLALLLTCMCCAVCSGGSCGAACAAA